MQNCWRLELAVLKTGIMSAILNTHESVHCHTNYVQHKHCNHRMMQVSSQQFIETFAATATRATKAPTNMNSREETKSHAKYIQTSVANKIHTNFEHPKTKTRCRRASTQAKRHKRQRAWCTLTIGEHSYAPRTHSHQTLHCYMQRHNHAMQTCHHNAHATCADAPVTCKVHMKCPIPRTNRFSKRQCFHTK